MTLDRAIRAADQLAARVQRDGVQPAYSELEEAVRKFQEEGYPIDSILPLGADSRLGFSLRNADGKSFFDAYSAMLRKCLCGADGGFNKLARSGVSASVSAVLSSMVKSLGIPSAAMGVMIPVAVIIAKVGVDVFCDVTRPEK